MPMRPALLAAISAQQFSPSGLFSAGEVGAWYDPSDFSTMFQDSAGSTPVTAVEQPVGLIRDKSGKGNHASQATSTSRPVLSARVNLLTYSEQFDNAAWVKSGVGTGIAPVVTANAEIAPDGTVTADSIVFDRGVGNTLGDRSLIQQTVSVTVSVNYTLSFWIKAATAGDIGKQLAYRSVAGGGYQTVTLAASWQRISIVETAALASSTVELTSRGTISTSNSVGVHIWGADLRVTNDGVGIPAYQRINAATDYDTNGFPLYLAFDGVDDSLSTASIDFSATDKMTVFAGVRKISDAATGVIVELTPTGTTNSFALFTWPPTTGWLLNSAGTVQTPAPATGTAGSSTVVLGALTDISGDIARVNLNGVQAGQSLADQGTGNYSNSPLYIGMRAGSSIPFNGRLYSLIVRGAASNVDQISRTETWANGKTRAY